MTWVLLLERNNLFVFSRRAEQTSGVGFHRAGLLERLPSTRVEQWLTGKQEGDVPHGRNLAFSGCF